MDYRVLWDSFPFSGFTDHSKIAQWRQKSEPFLELLKERNCILAADTGVGKTILAILIATALELRTLFLVPTRLLTNQHQELLKKITGLDRYPCRTITGQKGHRVWNDPADRFIFATGHLALLEFKRGKLDLTGFQLVILDEVHKASGAYPYVKFAQAADEAKVRLFGLSASPGANLAQIDKVKENCRIQELRRITIVSPTKTVSSILVPRSPTLNSIEERFTVLLYEAALRLAELGFLKDPGRFLTARELTDLKYQLDHSTKNSGYYQAAAAYARYRKLHHAYRSIMTESYATFLDYAHRLHTSDTTIAARTICSHTLFQEIEQLAQAEAEHPKVVKLLEVMQSLEDMRKGVLIFVYQRITGRYLKEVLNQKVKNVRAETIFGHTSPRWREQIIKRYEQHDINTLVATSVIEEGFSVPVVDTAIHFTMPMTAVSRLQREGRTGRFTNGMVIYLTLDHFLDQAPYWSTWRGVRTMKQIINGKISPVTRRQRDTLTLDLFEQTPSTTGVPR